MSLLMLLRSHGSSQSERASTSVIGIFPSGGSGRRPTALRLDYDIGTDFAWRFTIMNRAETAVVNTTGWAFSFMIKRSAHDADADALYEVASPDITSEGTYDADPTENTREVVVPIDDVDSSPGGDTPDWASGTAVWELKRTGEGVETVLRRGPIRLYRSVHGA